LRDGSSRQDKAEQLRAVTDLHQGQRLRRHRDPAGSHEYELNGGRWVKISERKTVEGGIVGVYTDITELKKREARLNELVEGLAQARDQAEQARTRLFIREVGLPAHGKKPN
jgi:hypothetical protein